MSLNGKRAVVCGASKGIGKAIAGTLAHAGMDTILLARSESGLRTVCNELDVSKGQDHRYAAVDLKDPDKVTQALSGYINESAPIHVLINNTGGPSPGPLFEADLQSLAEGFTMHVLASQAIMQALLPSMKKAGYGRIVNIISTSVKEPIEGLGVSNTIRGAMASWSKTLSKELAQYGITVNNILPGYTHTERLKEIIDMRAVTAGVEAEVMVNKMKRDVPANRFASANEIAGVVKFLCTEEAAYINGVNIPVDGGKTRSL